MAQIEALCRSSFYHQISKRPFLLVGRTYACCTALLWYTHRHLPNHHQRDKPGLHSEQQGSMGRGLQKRDSQWGADIVDKITSRSIPSRRAMIFSIKRCVAEIIGHFARTTARAHVRGKGRRERGRRFLHARKPVAFANSTARNWVFSVFSTPRISLIRG